MRKIIQKILIFVCLICSTSFVQASYEETLQDALILAQRKQYAAASAALFSLVRRPELKDRRGDIHLALGKILIEMNMPQVAAWQFVNIISLNDTKNFNKAVDLLMVVADELGDMTILNYAISKIKMSDFPAEHKDMLYYRMGEVKFDNKDYKGAIQAFEKVSENHRYFEMALYSMAMAYAHANDTDSAIQRFENLLNLRSKKGVRDNLRVSALMGLARTYYQKQNWAKSLYYYHLVPRDHEYWHQALFESSWAYLRSGKIRLSLGNFQSLHSSYYSDFYVPESLILRSIVYLYLCKYEEIDKVVSLFETNYGSVESKISQFIKSSDDPESYYNEVERGLLDQKALQNGKSISEGRLPYNVRRYLIGRGNISTNLDYLRHLYEEKRRIENMNYAFTTSSLGKYSLKLLASRIQNTKSLVGIKAKGHLVIMRAELKDLNEQIGFLRYELINLEKEKLQKKMAGEPAEANGIDANLDRDYYVKNGYEYYPFRGEFWLDEIGNYFYLGRSSCDSGETSVKK